MVWARPPCCTAAVVLPAKVRKKGFQPYIKSAVISGFNLFQSRCSRIMQKAPWLAPALLHLPSRSGKMLQSGDAVARVGKKS